MARRPDNPTPGLVLVDKPAGVTSHDVVSVVRRGLGTRRVGHAGTLDPMATGLLVLGVGKATKVLGYLTAHDKAYTATMRLGVATTTDDADGDVLSRVDASGVDEAAVVAAMATQTGDIKQVPTSVSAVKVDGVRAYRRVRQGETVELAPRAVRVGTFVATGWRRDGEVLDVDVVVECSAGTYVRALARDVGAALGVGGHLTALRRTGSGVFSVGEAVTVAEFTAGPELTLDMTATLRRTMPVRVVTAAEADRLAHGGFLAPQGIAGVHAAIDDSGTAVALLREERRSDVVAIPVVVLISPQER